MLEEAGAGKSPLGRSVLMDQVRRNATRFHIEAEQAEPCIRCTPERLSTGRARFGRDGRFPS